eukprot:TRINITY_DN15811_c0_g1_i2.p1 TRINITY_DN15811_c0_g1~~TRINITY_DN15811_c0_g1_i2.p1  ORF type:complete len:175 (+),score=4.04 TRINITY_DN15811_c0_g1_i2:45-527(+)
MKIPDDNACFWHCVNNAVFGGKETADALKSTCATAVKRDDTYVPYLECSISDYCKKVMHPDYWGGRTEMIILSKLLDISFTVIFNEGKIVTTIPETPNPLIPQRMYLHYVGKFKDRFTHYNLFVHNKDKGLFSSNDQAKELESILQVANVQTYPTEPVPC